MKAGESRQRELTNLWMRHGCPEKMTIHVRKTVETIILINGLTLEPESKTIDTPCAVCSRPLPEGRQKFCSTQCSERFKGETRRQRKIRQAEEALRILSTEKATQQPYGHLSTHSA